jgi:cytochrome c553
MFRSLALAALVLWSSASWAGTNEWLGPLPPGNTYPAGETDRQFEILSHDLLQRAEFQRVAAQTFRRDALILDADRDPLDVMLRRTEVLLADIRRMPQAPDLTQAAQALAELRAETARTAVEHTAERRSIFDRVCHLRREIAFSNPLLDFTDVLFVKRQRSCFNHMCDQFYGITQRPGGGLFVLSDAFGPQAELRDVLAESVVQNGRLQGQKLTGGPRRHWNLTLDFSGNLSGEETQGGSFLGPELSYDGRTIAFAYVECQGSRQHVVHTNPELGHWDSQRCYHLFRVGLDGQELRQLTDGTFNDFDPCWMPSGRLVFVSERRGGYLRCGRACPTFTLFDMAPDGRDIRCLSYHETNEWNPSVTRDGMIVYTRWDYVDRNAMAAHHPWIMSPDGRDPRAIQGNYTPRPSRPDMELRVRAIPGSHRLLATAAPHHGQAFGSLVMLDPQIADDEKMSPLRRVTPDVGFPESQGGTESYGEAWPLSEDYYLCSYDPVNVPKLNPAGMGAPGDPGTGYPNKPVQRDPNPRGLYGLYLVDSFGNKELIYRDPDIGCHHPVPVAVRHAPPVIPEASQRLAADPPDEATVGVINVYRSSTGWPPGTKISALRVYQVFPQTLPSIVTAHTGLPIPNTGSVNLVRAVLGTVPVEEDGSAHFVVPARRELFFQALDEQGLAVTSMRSGTQFQPGEKATCQGCHEVRHRAPATQAASLAMLRPPSQLQPDVDGTNPFSYPRLVQPVLDRHCVECHAKPENKAPSLAGTPEKFTTGWYPTQYFTSYLNLTQKFGFFNYVGYEGNGVNDPKLWADPKFNQTLPGQFGARSSKLYELLAKGHYDVQLPPEDMHRITVWLDSCSLFYGVYEEAGQQAQLRGEIARPTLE